MHPPRTLAGTYRPRQFGGARPEVDHLPRGIHGARVRTATQQETTQRVEQRESVRDADSLPSSNAEPTPPLARAVSNPALIGSCNRARISIGRAHEQGPGAVAPGVYCFNPFFLISARRAPDCTIQRALLRPRPRIVGGGKSPCQPELVTLRS